MPTFNQRHDRNSVDGMPHAEKFQQFQQQFNCGVMRLVNITHNNKKPSCR